ncbi:hypothetical protein STEG23_014951, partial [Scotinomys teguina]
MWLRGFDCRFWPDLGLTTLSYAVTGDESFTAACSEKNRQDLRVTRKHRQRPGWPQTHRDPPASASGVLGLKMCVTTVRSTLMVPLDESSFT